MLNTFIKTYGTRNYKHVTLVRHKGVVIALALDETQRIFYSVLDLKNAEIKSPLDVNYWLENPRELRFPNEIAEVGFGVADQTTLPVVKKGGVNPEPFGTIVRDDEKDFFLSTTARLSADAPFQALSDGKHVFIFRQAVAANDANNVVKRDVQGNVVKDKDGNPVKVVDATLLVDRFVLAGTELKTKMEVRFQRSRSKTRPQSRKDSLGAKDMNDAHFFEPTQELRLVRGLTNGRFAVLLLPTQIAGVQRWQIFAHNDKTGAMDSYNIERSNDGLFNTRGTQAPEPNGRAESAMKFETGNDYLALGENSSAGILPAAIGPTALRSGVKLGALFTQEVWLYPTATDNTPRGLINSMNTANAAPSIWIQNKSIRAGFGDGAKWYEFTTGPLLELTDWNHLAVSFDGKFYRVFINGEERHRASEVDVYVNGVKQDEREPLEGKQPVDAAIAFFGSNVPNNSFLGTIDEIRLWNRPRFAEELKADMNLRLTGLEIGLAGYWRFDEASGDTVFDQTDNANDATRHGGEWVTSTAPLGESSGLQRSSFRVAGRSFASAPTALLYFPQESHGGGNAKPLKQSGRVMLAVATKTPNGEHHEIAALDFGVSAAGKLAQTPEVLPLAVINAESRDGLSVNERLQRMSDLEQSITTLAQDVINLTDDIAVLNQVEEVMLAALQERSTTRTLPVSGYEELKNKIQALQDARANLSSKRAVEQALINEPLHARITLYEHSGYRGRSLSYGLGFVGYTQLNQHGFNDRISSISIPASLQVKVYQHANRGGDSTTFSESTSYVGNSWNDRISSMDISENPSFSAKIAAARQARITAQNNVTAAYEALNTERGKYQTLRRAKELERSDKEKEARDKRTEWQQHRVLLDEGVSVAMPLVQTDAFGLSLNGGVLGFAWTNEAPLLFESAGGKLALYFRGADDQFFTCYYNTFTQRAQYQLLDENGNPSVRCLARTTEAEMDRLAIEIRSSRSAGILPASETTAGRMPALLVNETPAGETPALRSNEDESLCTVIITRPNSEPQQVITETWRNVPRAPEKFSRVLNGLAGERAYIGSATVEFVQGRLEKINFAGGVRRALAEGATLLFDKIRLRVKENAERGALSINVESAATSAPNAELPAFFIEYDYAGLASSTKVPGDLSAGSLLIRAGALRSDGLVQIEQESKSGNTLMSQWTAASPGHTLSFNGQTHYAALLDTSAENLEKFAAPGDVTLEAWVRPREMQNEARLVQHKSDSSQYTLGLKRQPLFSALKFDGVNDHIQIPNQPHLNFTGAITIEAWIKPEKFDGIRNIVAHGFAASEVYLRLIDGNYEIGSWNGPDHKVTMPIPPEDKTGANWVHLAGVYDGSAWKIYRNGKLGNARAEATGALQVNANWAIGSRGGAAERLFQGAIDEVRIWKRGRSEAEIEADMFRQLGGNETDLVGYWHFENRSAQDYSRYQNHGVRNGNPALVESPLPAYKAFAGAGERFAQTKNVFAGGSWRHLAAVYNQSYAVELDGGDTYLDCGSDTTLDLNGDLTIEVFLEKRASGTCGVLAKGRIDDGTDQDTPYSLHLDENGKIVFAFEDSEHGNHEFASNANAVPRGYFNRIAVTRKLNVVTTEEKNQQGQVIGVKVEKWFDIKFYSRNANGVLVEQGAHKYEGADIGSSNHPLEIGRAFLAGLREARFNGVISEVRLWNVAREKENLGVEIKGLEKGLVSWWRFEENEGGVAFDSKSGNHARFKGNVKWIKNPEWSASQLRLYCNGESVPVDHKKASDFNAAAAPQFTLGALGNNPKQDFFQGELEEVRVWKIARTLEQVQDNLFRRLLGEKEDLIAYYTFDAEKDNKLSDHSLRGNDLTASGASYVLSTAPIGEDTPQVRSALASIRTPFHGLLQCRPAVQEYGDMQYDVDGNLLGVLKRCYAFIVNGQWHLVTGFKVGNLVTEWIGQAQFAPQLKGFIEGAPPVPSENLTTRSVDIIGDLDDYNEASRIELKATQKNTFTYTAEKDSGFDMQAELSAQFGGGAQVFTSTPVVPTAPLVLTEVLEAEVTGGVKASFELALNWLNEASVGSGWSINKNTSLELRGFFEHKATQPALGRRFLPENVGLALVESETADVFALRLSHNNALVAFQMRPNPDIPKDWNIIHFPINPHYTKQGTLDGKIGFTPDPNYPNALNYSPDSSYYKPIEAYALKNRIQREEEELRTYFEQFDAGSRGRRQEGLYGSSTDLASGRLRGKLPALEKRNIVNTYVWTADGGMFAETQETMQVWQETSGGAYAFQGLAGGFLNIDTKIFGASAKFDLNLMFGGHLNLTVKKTEESEETFGIDLNLDKVERDINKRDENGLVVIDRSDPRNPKPVKQPGKVDAYRFLTFYLEPKTDNFDAFFSKVIDPIWLEQSDDPNAAALREARQAEKKPPCWRVMHRVTFVSRILPEFDDAAAPPLERALKQIDIDSNYELIKLLEPFVVNKLTRFHEFAQAIRDAIKTHHPELQPHSEAIIQYLALYYGISEETAPSAGDEALVETTGAPALPTVDAGPEYHLTTINGALELQGTLLNNQQPLENLFVLWEKLSGPGAVVFVDKHALRTQASFSERGLYKLRLTVNDGLFAVSDEVEIVVNRPPEIFAGFDQEILPRVSAQLAGAVLDSGLGDPNRGAIKVKWSVVDAPALVHFSDDEALSTSASFTKSGSYLLRLTVSNGSFEVSDELTIAVAGRVTRDVQALYVFKEGAGAQINDVSSVEARLPLLLQDQSKALWVNEGLALQEPAILQSNASTARLVEAVQASNELTIEAWLKPASENQSGLARIITLASGVEQRNFILGQRGQQFYAAMRTSTTNNNASDKALAGGNVAANALTHVVCTRNAVGEMKLFVNGNEVAQRSLKGTFANWSKNFILALGNEPATNSAVDRAWSGEFHLVALYSRALNANEVKQNFEFGADTNLPPLVSAGENMIINLPNQALLLGKLLDERLTLPQLNVTWTQASGPTSVEFENANALEAKAIFSNFGRYVLRLTASDGQLSTSDELTVIVNQAPIIDAGETQRILMPNKATLRGAITSDGLGDETAPKSVRVTWQQTSGPRAASIQNPNALETEVSFPVYGEYEFELSVDNGHLPPATARTTIYVNQAPSFRASAEALIVTLPAAAKLLGEEIDLGLADPSGTVTRKWSKVSGPGEVIFSDANTLETTAQFSKNGVYVLKLRVETRSASFQLASEAELTITANAAPMVDAGADQIITLPALAELEGTVSDDGLPDPPSALTLKWEKVSGPGPVSFIDFRSPFTQARFIQSGSYVLRLSAQDYPEAAPVSDEVRVEVLPSPRVLEGLQALYTFTETEGKRIHDLAGTGATLDLVMENLTNHAEPMTWLQPGVRLNAPVILKGTTAPVRMMTKMKASNEITIEAWLKRAASVAANQSPANIVTLSLDTSRRNFTLGQTNQNRLHMRVRTTSTDDNGTQSAQERSSVAEVCHVVFTRDQAGNVKFYLNGADASNRPLVSGSFDNWDGSCKFALANELTGDRPWLGELYLVAIYSRALSKEEVQRNYGAGF